MPLNYKVAVSFYGTPRYPYLTEGTIVELNCNENFVMSGPYTSKCMPDLSWSLPGTCMPGKATVFIPTFTISL